MSFETSEQLLVNITEVKSELDKLSKFNISNVSGRLSKLTILVNVKNQIRIYKFTNKQYYTIFNKGVRKLEN